MESDVDVFVPSEKGQLEEKIECSIGQLESHPFKKPTSGSPIVRVKDTQKIHADTKQYVYTNARTSMRSRDFTHNLIVGFPYNLRKLKRYWCAICEEPTHNTIDYELNAKNHRVVYKTKVISNDQNQLTNFRSNSYNSRGGYNGQG